MREQLVLFETSKKCSRCGEVKGLDQYGYQKKGKYSKRSVCTQCRSQDACGNWFVPLPSDKKQCTDCKNVKPLIAFTLCNSRQTAFSKGRANECKNCNATNRLARYNEDIEQSRLNARIKYHKMIKDPIKKEKLLLLGRRQDIKRRPKRAQQYNDNTHQSVVYFMECEGWIKIGKTWNLKKRQIGIKSKGYNHPIHVSGKLPYLNILEAIIGSYTEETQIHHNFPIERYGHTDWFKATPELYDFISKVDIAS